MHRIMSDKQFSAELLYLWFCCTPKFKLSCKAIVKMAQFIRLFKKSFITGIKEKLQPETAENITTDVNNVSGLLTLKPSDVLKISI